MSLLPSSYDSSSAADGDPRVVGVESDEADEIFAALSAGTARQLLVELHDSPGPPAELADRVDTSVQNVQYHLEKLETAGAIEVVETAYSEKGREMSVYAPADQPLVIFAGEEDEQSSLRTAISRFLGSVGILALASAVVQAVFGERLLPLPEATTPPMAIRPRLTRPRRKQRMRTDQPNPGRWTVPAGMVRTR